MSDTRGARDLADLWRALPAAVLVYPAAAWRLERGLNVLSDTLRAHAWRDHCAAFELDSCADRGCGCVHPGRCVADGLFPMKIGGGTPSWRMATLFVHWLPTQSQLRLLALGEVGCRALGWAARCLQREQGLTNATPLAAATLADFALPVAERWQLTFVTPWLVSKGTAATNTPPDAAAIAYELNKALRLRAYKLTALCLMAQPTQRLVAHLTHYVADALLPTGLGVEEADVVATPLALASQGNRARFVAMTWSGQVILQVSPMVLPWLNILALCGGGENADKGFGGIELTPLASGNSGTMPRHDHPPSSVTSQ